MRVNWSDDIVPKYQLSAPIHPPLPAQERAIHLSEPPQTKGTNRLIRQNPPPVESPLSC